jgi:APA family basic amino acid/polyamine antiporter
MGGEPQGTGTHGLRRELRLFDALMINVGTILASAIFVVPAYIIADVETPFLSTLVWVVAGILSWFGAVTLAELGALYPEAGGEYVYLEKAYHPLLGFLYGWTLFSVIQTASIAAVAVVFMTYLGYFFPMSGGAITGGAIVLIIGLSVWNTISLRTSANTQNLTTVAKLIMVGIIAIVCLLFGKEGGTSFAQILPDTPARSLLGSFGIAMVAALWAYDGWISVTFVGGEVREPQRFLPKSLSYSVLILIVVYVVVNFAYMKALPLDRMAGTERVAADAVENALGPTGGRLVSLAVIISCFSAVNGFIFTGARVYYAMAEDGRFFSSFAKLNRNRIPQNSILAQAAWASVLALTGTYDQLFTYVVFTSWLAYALAAAGVIVLRIKKPELPRPYKALGYPVLPMLFVALATLLLINTLIEDPRDSLVGMGIVAAGVPLYFYWTRRKTN